jgi:hypothetical protein
MRHAEGLIRQYVASMQHLLLYIYIFIYIQYASHIHTPEQRHTHVYFQNILTNVYTRLECILIQHIPILAVALPHASVHVVRDHVKES